MQGATLLHVQQHFPRPLLRDRDGERVLQLHLSDSCRRCQCPAGQHPREVTPVVGRAVQVGRRLGALVRAVRGRPQGRPGWRRAPGAAASAALARTGTGPMLVRPILALATCPLARLASAATPTIAQACAVRWNFS